MFNETIKKQNNEQQGSGIFIDNALRPQKSKHLRRLAVVIKTNGIKKYSERYRLFN